MNIYANVNASNENARLDLMHDNGVMLIIRGDMYCRVGVICMQEISIQAAHPMKILEYRLEY